MRTAYIDRRDASLDAEAGAVVVRVNGERVQSLPLALLDRVVLRAPAQLSTRLLAALWERDIGLLVLSGRRSEPTARFVGRPYGDVGLRMAQYRLLADPAGRLPLATAIVAAKIAGHARQLDAALARGAGERRALLAGRRQLAELAAGLAAATPASLGSLLGTEGAGSAAYFQGYRTLFAPSLGFKARNRRPPRDPVNACLSLAYTLLHHEAVCAAQLRGLDPMIGILHEPAAGRESLACDIVEPLRAHADRLVWELFAEGILRRDHFVADGNACLLGKAGRERFYTAWQTVARPLARLSRRSCTILARRLAGADGGEGA
jgi:CRISPR-associated protein Cas1